MAATIFFDKKQRFWVGEALKIAEYLAADYFQVDLEDADRFPYDIQTLANLKDQEKTQRALAQVCKYEYQKREAPLRRPGKEFYRICLQDDKILNTVKMERPFLLKPLLLYVVTHELIHVIRFSIDPQKFYLNTREKKVEERDVHRNTYEILRSFKDPHVGLMLERYRPWWGKKSRAEAASPALDKF